MAAVVSDSVGGAHGHRVQIGDLVSVVEEGLYKPAAESTSNAERGLRMRLGGASRYTVSA